MLSQPVERGDREFPEALYTTLKRSTVHDPCTRMARPCSHSSHQNHTVYPYPPGTSTSTQHLLGKACAGNSSMARLECQMPWPQPPIHPASCFSPPLMRGGSSLAGVSTRSLWEKGRHLSREIRSRARKILPTERLSLAGTKEEWNILSTDDIRMNM